VTLPITPVTLPADLVGQPNGRIPSELLVDVGPSGLLHHLAARAWKALVADAAANGLPLTYTYGGTYRTIPAQTVLFESRYVPGGAGGGCKFYKGGWWCKKTANLSTAAVPGTSNHGIGLAVDSAAGVHPQSATSISSHPQWPWFRANVERYGFSWELQSEAWHIRYVTGDAIPQAVLDYETPTQPTDPPAEGKPISMFRIRYRDSTYAPNAYTGLICNGPQLGWIGNGNGDTALGKGGAHIVDDLTSAELDGLIATVQTTTDPPPEFSDARKAAWNARRG
jgi:hypothetical protein